MSEVAYGPDNNASVPDSVPAASVAETIIDLRGAGSRREAVWQDAAMCRGNTDMFFGPPGERDGRRRRREALARAYCACCPVAKACRDAGRSGREHGLWGGENDEERARAGYAPRSPHRRSVAAAARESRKMSGAESSDDGAEVA